MDVESIADAWLQSPYGVCCSHLRDKQHYKGSFCGEKPYVTGLLCGMYIWIHVYTCIYIYIEKVVTALCEGDLQLINGVRCGEVMHRVCCSCNYLLKAVAAKLLYRVCSNLMSHVSLFNSNVTQSLLQLRLICKVFCSCKWRVLVSVPAFDNICAQLRLIAVICTESVAALYRVSCSHIIESQLQPVAAKHVFSHASQ